MRIVFCVNKLSGGAGNVVQQLASHFSQSPDNEVTVTIIEDNGTVPKYDFSKVKVVNRNLDQCQMGNPFEKVRRFFRILRETRAIIMASKPDVVVSFLNSISPEVLFSMIGTGVPVIVSERSNPYQEWSNNSKLFNFKWWLSYKLADKIVYQFDAFSDFFKYAKRRGRAAVIPNMIYTQSEILPKVSSDKVRFCTFASLIPLKRQELMIDIFESVHKAYPETELNIYGEGPLYDILSAKAEKSGGVNIKGAVQNSYMEYPNNDVFLLTSEREGFPNALLEAMAAGLPSIAFRCHDGLKELLDGTDGFLVDDTDSFEQAMRKFILDPSLIAAMGESAKRLSARYSSDKVFAQWERLIISS